MTRIGEDLDLAVRNVPGPFRRSASPPNQSVFSAEDDQGRRLDPPQLSAWDVDRLPNSRLALSHDPHPWPELPIDPLALPQGPEDNTVKFGLRRPYEVPREGDQDCKC